MNRGGRWLAIGLAVAVLLGVLPMAAVSLASASQAAAQDQGSGEPDRTDPWFRLDDPIPGPAGPSSPSDDLERADQHVINGTPIAIDERPWHVLMSDESFGGTWCGGSILAANLILTAAHCVDNENLDPSRTLVVAGSDQWRDLQNGQWRFASKVTIHPSYNPDAGFTGSQGLDLALIELARPLTFNESVQPIELADPTEAAAALGGDADLVGWGVNTLPARDGSTVTELLNGEGEIVSDLFCGTLIGRQLNAANEMCIDGIATDQTGCFGDSGGGTTMEIGGERKLLGVASFTVLECGLDLLVLAQATTAAAWIEENTPPLTVDAAFVTGRVWDDVDLDSIEDPDEGGLAGIKVNLQITPPSVGVDSPILLTAFTDADGRYSFVAPFGGWYQVQFTLDPLIVVSPPNGAGDETNNTDVSTGSIDPEAIENTVASTSRFLVVPGQTEADIDLGATPGTLVFGRVFDDVNRNGRWDLDETQVSGVNGFVDMYRFDDEGNERYFAYRDMFTADDFTFVIPAGLAFLSFFDGFTSRRVTLPNRGDDDLDNDFSPFTNRTDTFSPVPGERLSFDLGLTPAGSGDVFADVANIDCDAQVSIIDALLIAQYTAGLRTDGVSCPLANPQTQLHVANADMNLDGSADIIDALLIAQCDAGLVTPFCAAIQN